MEHYAEQLDNSESDCPAGVSDDDSRENEVGFRAI